jgi:hypothetical protein
MGPDIFLPRIDGVYGEIMEIGEPGQISLSYPEGCPPGVTGEFRIDGEPKWRPIPTEGIQIPVTVNQVLRIKAEYNGQEDTAVHPGHTWENMKADFVFNWDLPDHPQVTIEARSEPMTEPTLP